MSVSAACRFSSLRPCPICGGHPLMARGRATRCHGFLSADERFAHCTREEVAGALRLHEASQSYAHRLGSPCACGVTHKGAPQVAGCFTPCEAALPQAPACRGRVLREADFARCPKPYPCDYTNASGAVLYRVARWQRNGEKSYSVHHPVSGGWARGRGGAQRVLYGLPDVLSAVKRGETVHVVEGEKKVHLLRALGFVATCNCGGAGKFARGHAESLRSVTRVIVWADNDETGKTHAGQIAWVLRGEGIRDVRLPALPGLKHREGLDDWLARSRVGASVVELRAELHRFAEEVKP